ncbi:hypothetical protein BURKHO8Y_370013 [Burkholderia sp. 8Y]|nr:hypothetical protein BURKHO8Y_370013 [Burkholderia sp. 8Y]
MPSRGTDDRNRPTADRCGCQRRDPIGSIDRGLCGIRFDAGSDRTLVIERSHSSNDRLAVVGCCQLDNTV